MQGLLFYSEGFISKSVLLIDTLFMATLFGVITTRQDFFPRTLSHQRLEILNVNQLNNQQTILFVIDLFNSKLL